MIDQDLPEPKPPWKNRHPKLAAINPLWWPVIQLLIEWAREAWRKGKEKENR